MIAIALIFALAGLVWGTIVATRGNLLLGCVAVLFATSTLGVYFFQFNAGITLSLDRLAIVGLVAAAILQWKMGKLEIRPWMTIDTVMAAFFAVLLVNTFMHDFRTTLPGQVPIVQHLINGYLIPLTVYVVARNLKYDEQQFDWLLMALTAFGVYLAAIGIFEGLGLYGLVFPRYIADPEIGLHFGRARGPMVQSVSYGVYLCGCLVATWLLWIRTSSKWQYFLLGLIPLFLAAVFFTKTRTVWLGCGASLMACVFLTLQGKTRTVLLAGMITAGLLAVVAKSDAIMGLQREGTVTDTRRSVSMRASFTYVSWQMFLDKPIAGHGFSQFKQAKLPYLSDRNVDLILESIRDYDHHNTFLSVLTDLGLLGFVPFLAMYGLWTRTSWRLARSGKDWQRLAGTLGFAVFLIACCQMIGHEITFTPIDHLLIFLVAGMTTAVAFDQGLVRGSTRLFPQHAWHPHTSAQGS